MLILSRLACSEKMLSAARRLPTGLLLLLLGCDYFYYCIDCSVSAPGPKDNIFPPDRYLYDLLLSGDWPSFYAKYCQRHCVNRKLLNVTGNGNKFECFRCDCEATCVHKGTCCPNLDPDTDNGSYTYYHDTNTYTHSTDLNGTGDPPNPKLPDDTPDTHVNHTFLDKMYERIECVEPPLSVDAYLTVIRCPKHWQYDDIREKCERPNITSVEMIQPCYDYAIHLMYRNRFCVICHGLDPHSFNQGPSIVGSDWNNPTFILRECLPIVMTNHVLWDFTTKIMGFNNPLDVLISGLNNMIIGTEAYYGVGAHPIKTCTIEDAAVNGVKNIPGTCVTDSNFDRNKTDMIGDLCQKLPNIPALHVDHYDGGYRNIFCALCEQTWPFKDADHEQLIYDIKEFTFAKIVDQTPNDLWLWYGSPSTTPKGALYTCWSNNTERCIKVNCDAGKFVTDQLTCASGINRIDNDFNPFYYTLRMLFIPTSPLPDEIAKINFEVFDSPPFYPCGLKELFSGTWFKKTIISHYECKDKTADSSPSNSNQRFKVLDHTMSMMINCPERDLLDRDLIALISMLHTNDSSEFLVEVVDTQFKKHSVSVKLMHIGDEMSHAYRTALLGENDKLACEMTRVEQEGDDEQLNNNNNNMLGYDIEFKDVTPSIACPFISVNHTDYDVRFIDESSIQFSVMIDNTEYDFKHEPLLVSMVDSHLRICVQLYQKLVLNNSACSSLRQLSPTQNVFYSIALSFTFLFNFKFSLIY